MSSSMEFWATCVKPNKPVKVTVQDGMTLRLTQVAPHHLARGRANPAPACHGQAGTGNTAGASATEAGKITLMSLSSTCVTTGTAPVFWPFSNFVGP